jgi:hypothetical protein
LSKRLAVRSVVLWCVLLVPGVCKSVSGMRMNQECYEVSCASHGTCPLGLGSSDQGFVQHMNTTLDDMSGPVASTLVLLSDLKTAAQGTKVRFLGWY